MQRLPDDQGANQGLDLPSIHDMFKARRPRSLSHFFFFFFIPCSARFKSEWPLGVSGPSVQCGHSCSEDRIRRGRIWVSHYAVHLLFWFFPTNDRNPRLPSPCLKSSSVSPEQTGGVNAAAGTKACGLITVPGKTNTPSHMSEINLVM